MVRLVKAEAHFLGVVIYCGVRTLKLEWMIFFVHF
jgi:hypothetical protein